MTIQEKLEADTATCANTECGKPTHYILVDPVDEVGMVFCSWGCLAIYAFERNIPNALGDLLEKVKDYDTIYMAFTQKAHWCPYQPRVFCQEGDCQECFIYQEVQK